MKITKRLCRLEGTVVSRQFPGPSPAEILRERKRRRLGKAYCEAGSWLPIIDVIVDWLPDGGPFWVTLR
jgi:hypothetical protein